MIQRLFRSGGRDDGYAPPETSPPPAPLEAPPRAPPATGPARPIRFVYCDEKGKFRIEPEALAILQLVKEPIGVVSVCGRARQGKSFILNQFLEPVKAWVVSELRRSDRITKQADDFGLELSLVDSLEQTLNYCQVVGMNFELGTYSTQIFSLAVLLSSMFIYNQMGGIDEVALDRLSLVTEMTKHIRVRASGGKTTASELGQFSPMFVWLLRDFYLDLTEDNRKITPRDYVELALRPGQGGAKDVAAKNEVLPGQASEPIPIATADA
ncbi:hypothetical protein Cgig2_028865 [Carnegiea gigantea]|uniref:GB1/RHD3-type G domain-containing protein n=1 Tax=Carnegiea gigantea TaxID=171969 RepID=A0A9Q1QN73_9CARY|nr:hypothetical protein Cgig2_028865 [Carnegiea gigantea]